MNDDLSNEHYKKSKENITEILASQVCIDEQNIQNLPIFEMSEKMKETEAFLLEAWKRLHGAL